MIEYSIIIPHKNIPHLLQRCLDSIPIREDTEVIVVDDNSSPQKVEFDNFPKWKGKHYYTYFTKEGNGAGYARNQGIKHAIGKWIIFADADDEYVTSNFSKLLDLQKDKYDVICWPANLKNINGAIEPYTVSWRYGKDTFDRTLYGTYKIYDNYLPDILYVLFAPWNKMTKLDFIKKHALSFTEIPACNDIYFSTCLASKTTNVGIYSDVVYLYIRRKNSISEVDITKQGTQRLEFHLKELFKVQHMLFQIKKEKFLEIELGYVFDLLEQLSIKKTILFCFIQMKEVSPIIGFKSLKKYLTYNNVKTLIHSILRNLNVRVF